MSEMKSLHIWIEGRVQGVGFRYFTEKVARQSGVNGYVRNLPDGRVEAYAEGDEDSLQQFLQHVKRGPSLSHVTQVKERWGEAQGSERSFRVTF